MFAFRRKDLFAALPLVGRENRQHERTWADTDLLGKGERVSAVKVDTGGLMGSNARADLAALALDAGADQRDAHDERRHDVDPSVTYIDGGGDRGGHGGPLP